MGRSIERVHDNPASVWGEDADEQSSTGGGWLKAWQRWAAQRRLRRAHHAGARVADLERSEATTLPEAGRGQALRLAHRALRDRMRAQRELRRVLPHLYFVERALSRNGSVALMETPVWVLQRALQQLSRLPADSLDERVQLAVLQQRLVEAIRARSLMPGQHPRSTDVTDSFMGGLDSQLGTRFGPTTGSGGLEVSEVPRSVYDDLLQGTLPSRDEAANTSGWRRS